MPRCLTVRVPALDGAQPPTAFGAMKANVLQKQNVSLQSSLQSARREIEDTETRLKAATATLEARDSALSTYERQWLQLEEQLSLPDYHVWNQLIKCLTDIATGEDRRLRRRTSLRSQHTALQ